MLGAHQGQFLTLPARCLNNINEPDNPSPLYRKLAWFTQENLWDNNSIRPSSRYPFEPAFEIADCIDDYDALIQEEVTTPEETARSDRTSKWYEVVYGTSFGLNQAYRTKKIEQVVDLVNTRGETQLHKKLELDKTKDFAAAADRLVDDDSQGDLQEINTIINSAQNQDLLIQYHDLMELARLRIEQPDRAKEFASQATMTTPSAVDQAIADNTYSLTDQAEINEVPLPLCEYLCQKCGETLYFTRKERTRCFSCGWRMVLKPRPK
jgi:DNA-directed RNA polymerase subunit RPC12/RpoP